MRQCADGVHRMRGEAAAAREAVAGAPLRRRMRVPWGACKCNDGADICTPSAPKRVRNGSGRVGPVQAVGFGHAGTGRTPGYAHQEPSCRLYVFERQWTLRSRNNDEHSS